MAGTWTSRPTAAIGAAAPSSATVGVALYEFGGLSSVDGAVQSNSAYDPATATWKMKESPPSNVIVDGPMAGSYDGLIYSFVQSGTWIYNPANDINP